MKMIKFIITFFALTIWIFDVFAIRESRPAAIDSRIRVMVYNPDDVFKFIGYLNSHVPEFRQPDKTISKGEGREGDQ